MTVAYLDEYWDLMAQICFFTNKFNPKTTFQKASLLDHLESLFRMCCFLYVESWEHRKVGGLFKIAIWVVFYAQI